MYLDQQYRSDAESDTTRQREKTSVQFRPEQVHESGWRMLPQKRLDGVGHCRHVREWDPAAGALVSEEDASEGFRLQVGLGFGQRLGQGSFPCGLEARPLHPHADLLHQE